MKRSVGHAIAALALLAACAGDDDDTPAAAADTTDESTVESTPGEASSPSQPDIAGISGSCPQSVPYADATLALTDQLSEPANDDVFSSPLICVFEGASVRVVLNAERPYPGTERRWDDITGDSFGAADCDRCSDLLGDVPRDFKVRGDGAHEAILTTLRNRYVCVSRMQQLPPEPPADAVIDFLVEANDAICAPAGA